MAMLKFLSPTLHAVLMAPADEGGAGGGGSDDATAKAAAEAATKAAADAAKKKEDEKIDPLTTDIKAAIEKARKQEKDKLYGQIEETKKAAKLAEDLAAARDNEVKTLKQQMAELTAKLNPEGDEGEKKKSKKAELNEEMLNKAIDAAVNTTASKFQEVLDAAQKRINELEKGNELKDLNAFRDQLISQNKDYIVPELVNGTTRDEIEQSLVLAKQVFARVTQGMKKDEKKGGEGDGNAPEAKRTLQLPPVLNVNDNGAPGAPRQVDVKQLSTKDYKANRAELLKAAAAAARSTLAAE